MINILITGSNGQLGSELKKSAALFNDANLEFTDVDVLDITNREALASFCSGKDFKYIINCAAFTAVDKAETENSLAHKINVDAVRNLAELASAIDAFLIHISTDYVFAGKNFLPYTESDPISPQSAYGRTKADGEAEALKYAKTIIVRTSWLYSSFGNNFVKTMLKLTKEREQVNVIFDQIGTPTYAGDLAKAIISIVNYQQANKPRPGIYHYSNEGVCSWYDFATEIAELAGNKAKVFPIETKDYPSVTQRPYYSVLNKSKIKATFGITIPHWKESLKICLKEINR
ncbi:MAG TPA: dTDP-4-dehydrorhamnose reductase [Bacteroidales bacterium]|nr:dTDP-4-dehydrorhamnose reductase [Bacteroidales bacterium]